MEVSNFHDSIKVDYVLGLAILSKNGLYSLSLISSELERRHF